MVRGGVEWQVDGGSEMSKHLSVSEKDLSAKRLRAIAQVADMGKLDELDRAIQAVIENTPQGESSLDYKIEVEFDGVGFTAGSLKATIVLLDEYSPSQTLKRHPNGGGWVPLEQSEEDETMPWVAETVYVGPFAQVRGKARVEGDVKIQGRAVVLDRARISGSVVIGHSAGIYDHACLSGNAQVLDSARVCGRAQISGNAMIRGSAVVSGEAVVDGNATIEEAAEVRGSAHVTGSVRLRGMTCLGGHDMLGTSES